MRTMTRYSSLEDLLPHFDSEEEDWQRFAYLLDSPEYQEKLDQLEISSDSVPVLDDHIEDNLEVSEEEDHPPGARRGPTSPPKAIDPRDISLGSPSKLQPVENVKKEDEDSLSVGERVHRKRNSESEKEDEDKKKYKAADAKHCVACQHPFNPHKFYVQCHSCTRCFHGKCVGVNEKQYRREPDWKCSSCASGDELYCLCMTPYDDSQFYVGCDGCEGWFHPSCVGITQEEAEMMAEYLCPECRKDAGGLSQEDYRLLVGVHDMLFDHRLSVPFRSPSNSSAMDLGTIRHKLDTFQYRKLTDFTQDVRLIFRNAKLCHEKTMQVYKCADTLERKFEERMEQVTKEIETRQKSVREPSNELDSGLDPSMFHSLS